MAGANTQRIDKWLWFARLAKTRTAAQGLALSGRVRLNGEKNDSASRPVKAGDVLTIGLGSGVKVLKVLLPGERRGPASEAQLLYEDLSPPPVPRPAEAGTPSSGGRPNKRDRRQIEAFRDAPMSRDKDFPGDEE